MAFSFGAPATQQAQPAAGGGGLFGAKPAGTTTTFGGFGAPAQASTSTAPAPAAGMFGAKPAGGGLFGSTQSQGQQPQPQAGGLFGGQQQQQPAAGGLFGQQQPQQPPAGGIFGQQQQQQPAAGGLFGQPQQQQQQPAQPAGGLFGAKPAAPATGGGLFGSTTQQAQPSGGLFGASTNQPQQPAGSLFGSTAQPQQGSTGGLFGSQAAPAGGLFGAQPQQQQQQQQQQPQGTGLFGSTTQQLQNSLFASQAQPQSSLLQSTSQPTAEVDIGARMEAVKNAWDVGNADCCFKYFFYNLVEPGTAHLYGRPANATDDRAWDKARRENPDPSRYVPALAVGFEDLQKRIEAQARPEAAHKAKIAELTAALNALTRQTTLQTSLRAQEISHRLTTLSHRLLTVLVNSPLLIPTLRSTPIRREEEQLHQQLEALVQDLDGPGGMGRVKGRVDELWAVVGALRARRNRGGKREGWGLESSALEELASILAKQQQALQLLTTLCQTNLDDAQIISKNLGLPSSSPA